MFADDFEEKDKDRKETQHPADVEGLEEPGDEVEYEPVSEEGTAPVRPEKAGHTPPSEEDKGLKNKLKKKDAEIKALRKERDEIKDKYLRKLAEMENLRKRFDRERVEHQQYALSEFLREMLVVLDNFERALKIQDQADGKSFQEGVEMIHRQYSDLLKKQGVRPIESSDRKFDPAVHQAVLTEESDTVEEPEVAEVLQRGFWLQDRLLRPAMVKVVVPKKKEEEK
ncbi:MAG: nucleotide exchange factor GrpE [Candidatus Aminicenantales bacterium]